MFICIRLSARCECELDIITVEDGKEEQVFWDVLMDQHSAYSPVASMFSSCIAYFSSDIVCFLSTKLYYILSMV